MYLKSTQTVKYSSLLGDITDEQFSTAVAKFDSGQFVSASPVSGGLFGQNVFVTTTTGEFVLRCAAHYDWQFPTEQFFADELARFGIPTPQPYLVSYDETVFGHPFGFVLMPKLPGTCFADADLYAKLELSDRLEIAVALGSTAAMLSMAIGNAPGRFDLTTKNIAPYVRSFTGCLEAEARRLLQLCTEHGSASSADVSWTLQTLASLNSEVRTRDTAVVFTDFNKNNVTFENTDGQWVVSGVFDLMECSYGDPVATAARQFSMFMDEDRQLADVFLNTYSSRIETDGDFAGRMQRALICERLLVWEYFTRPVHDTVPSGFGSSLKN